VVGESGIAHSPGKYNPHRQTYRAFLHFPDDFGVTDFTREWSMGQEVKGQAAAKWPRPAALRT
jgi:hypothetical protein